MWSLNDVEACMGPPAVLGHGASRWKGHKDIQACYMSGGATSISQCFISNQSTHSYTRVDNLAKLKLLSNKTVVAWSSWAGLNIMHCQKFSFISCYCFVLLLLFYSLYFLFLWLLLLSLFLDTLANIWWHLRSVLLALPLVHKNFRCSPKKIYKVYPSSHTSVLNPQYFECISADLCSH